MKPTLVFIHGAFSTPEAFNYFRLQFADYNQFSFTYDWNDHPSQVGQDLAEMLIDRQVPAPFILLGHSLGGNVAISALPCINELVQQVITYASPLGGSPHAILAGLFSRAKIFAHIAPRSSEIKLIKKTAKQYTDKITSFIAERGPISNHNDGVITVASQRAVRGLEYVPVATNHMEILLSNNVVSQTRQIIEQ